MPADKELMQTAQYCLLLFVLALATAARFYNLDQLPLSAYELDSAGVCKANNWLELARHQRDFNGIPPLYPLILCNSLAWFENSEFMVRLPSALFGMATIYLAFCFGRRFFSIGTGLLAAAFIAFDLRFLMASREGGFHSMQVFVLLLHAYFFLQLILATFSKVDRAASLHYQNGSTRLDWTWKPAIAVDGPAMAGFVITGVIALYTTYTTMLCFITELLICIWAARSPASALCARDLPKLWQPMLIAILPLLPALLGLGDWIIRNEVIYVRSMDELMVVFRQLFFAPTLFLLLFAGGVIAAIGLCLRTPQHSSARITLYFLLLSWLIALLIGLITPPGFAVHYLFWTFPVFLLTAYALAYLVETFLPERLQQTAIIGLIVMINVPILQNIVKVRALYSHEVNADFRYIQTVLAQQPGFTSTRATIFANSPHLAFYLQDDPLHTLQVVRYNRKDLEKNLFPTNGTFYYLEYQPDNREMLTQTPVSLYLSQHYATLCATRLHWLSLQKFTNPSPNISVIATPPDCRDSRLDPMLMK